MNALRYLNAVLTVMVVLMALGLWTWWAGPSGDRSLTVLPAAHAAGIPDAGSQRKQIVDELKGLSQRVESLSQLFRTGQARVKLDSPPKQKR